MIAPEIAAAAGSPTTPTLPDLTYHGFRMWLGEPARGGPRRTRAAAVASCRAEFLATTGAEADVLVANPLTVAELAALALPGVELIADRRLAPDELWLGRLKPAARP